MNHENTLISFRTKQNHLRKFHQNRFIIAKFDRARLISRKSAFITQKLEKIWERN